MLETSVLKQKVLDDPEYGRTFLQEKAKLDLRYFCRIILGFTDMNAEHDALCDFLQHDRATTKLILMPRYTFKSSICTIGHTLWLLLRDPNERVLLASDATEKAEGFLLGIKNHLLGLSHTSKFRAICGAWEVDPKQGVWNQGALVISPRTQAHSEPSVDTAGLETSKVGKHYSRLKFDDLVSDKNITSKELMDKVESCYKKSLSLLQPSGSVELIGTRWHYGDLYGRLLAEYAGQASFSVFLRKAHEERHYFFADIGKDSLTPSFLTQKRATQGSYLYSCLYQNEPVDDETATFKASDFTFYDQVPKGCYITCTVDPAISQSSTADDTAITVCATDSNLNLYILDLVAGHLLPDDIMREVFSLHERWGFHALGMETQAFQKMLRFELERRISEARRTNPTFKFFQVSEFTGLSHQSKEMRIRALQPYHERGALKFPGTKLELLTGDWSKLAYQLLQFPHSAHDDLADSLAYHVQIHRAGYDTPQEPVLNPLSPVALEREWFKKEYARWAHEPRWKRGHWPTLSLS